MMDAKHLLPKNGLQRRRKTVMKAFYPDSQTGQTGEGCTKDRTNVLQVGMIRNLHVLLITNCTLCNILKMNSTLINNQQKFS